MSPFPPKDNFKLLHCHIIILILRICYTIIETKSITNINVQDLFHQLFIHELMEILANNKLLNINRLSVVDVLEITCLIRHKIRYKLDTSYQYTVSLGSFSVGGELCLEQPCEYEGVDRVIEVVDTHDKIACCDGRYVH